VGLRIVNEDYTDYTYTQSYGVADQRAEAVHIFEVEAWMWAAWSWT